MNREQVMKLSDDELRIKAAMLLGCRVQINPGGAISELGDGQHRRYRDARIPDFPKDIAAAMSLAEAIADRYWLELKTPFQVGDPFFAGFTPLATTGWNGVPDNQCPGEKPGQAISRAFILTMEGDDAKED